MLLMCACTGTKGDLPVDSAPDTQDESPPPDLLVSSEGAWSALRGSDFGSWCAIRDGDDGTCWGSFETTIGDVELLEAEGSFACGLAGAEVTCVGDLEPPSEAYTQMSCTSGGGYQCCGVTPERTIGCWGIGYVVPPDPAFIPEGANLITVGPWSGCAAPEVGPATCFNDYDWALPTGLPDATYVSLSLSGNWLCGLTAVGDLNCNSLNLGDVSFLGATAFALGFETGSLCMVDTSGVVACVQLYDGSQADEDLAVISAEADALNARAVPVVELAWAEGGDYDHRDALCGIDAEGYIACAGYGIDPPP